LCTLRTLEISYVWTGLLAEAIVRKKNLFLSPLLNTVKLALYREGAEIPSLVTIIAGSRKQEAGRGGGGGGGVAGGAGHDSNGAKKSGMCDQ
jgi:uncharacterized membrane protein